MRPQSIIASVIGLALVLAGTSPADAKRGRRSKKSRSAAPAQAQPAAPDDAATAPDAAPAADAGKSPRPGAPAGKADKTRGEKVFDFTGLELAGSVRMPQLPYFLDRGGEEREGASLGRRSFVRAMMRSLDEENL